MQGALGDRRNTLRQISDKRLCFASKRSIATGHGMKELVEYVTIHIAFTIQPYIITHGEELQACHQPEAQH